MEELTWSAAEGVAPGAAPRRWSAQRLVAMVLNGLSPLEAQQMTASTSDPHPFRSAACQIRRECIDNPSKQDDRLGMPASVGSGEHQWSYTDYSMTGGVSPGDVAYVRTGVTAVLDL